MTQDFPDDVRQFIQRNIGSLAQSELLLLLFSEPQRQWTAPDIAKLQFTSTSMSTSLLQDLTHRGVAKQMGDQYQYQYNEGDLARDEIIQKLGETYRQRRVAVTTEIYSKPTGQLKSFADAFRLRKG